MNDDGSRKELYNIPKDRAEQNNLAAEYPEVVEKLTAELKNWKKSLPRKPPAECISKHR